jgi:hypothetical protein
MFAMPFEEIASMLERTPEATRQLASRARRRVRGAAPPTSADRARQLEVAEAFKAASREGNFERLVSVLHPDVVLRADTGAGQPLHERVGAQTVASQAILFRSTAPESDTTETVLVNGAPGLVQVRGGRPFSVVSFTIADGLIVQMDIIADPDRLERLGIGDSLRR